MTILHVLRVFVGPDGTGGNLLGVFLDGPAIRRERRQAITIELGFSETVFVDDAAGGTIRIFMPTQEVAFAGHPSVGAAWLLRHVGTPSEVLRLLAGDAPVRFDEERTWIRAKAEWLPDVVRIVELDSPAEVEAHPGQALGAAWLYVWAWQDETAGRIRARSFPTDYGILEDEATGSVAVVLGARLGRPLTIRQGVGSEIDVRPHVDGTVDIGGRTEILETRTFVV